jgi:hypothetical protein
MDGVKTARLIQTPDHEDSVVDKIGYTICYWDIIQAQKQMQRRNGNAEQAPL